MVVKDSGKPIGSEEFFNWMVETLGITIDIDRRPKGRPLYLKILRGKRKSDITSPNPTRSLINFIISNYIR